MKKESIATTVVAVGAVFVTFGALAQAGGPGQPWRGAGSQPCFGTDDRRDGQYPNALDFAATVLSLPIHPFVSEAEVAAIIHAIREFMTRHPGRSTDLAGARRGSKPARW